jgi:hypothetical protein
MQSPLCWKKTYCLEECWGRDNRVDVAMNGAIYHERQVSVILKQGNIILYSVMYLNKYVHTLYCVLSVHPDHNMNLHCFEEVKFYMLDCVIVPYR